MHHGVRIKDAALVAAAVLSNRYITDRFLPDKAIDLVDEAAARLRTEIDSMPAELDEISPAHHAARNRARSAEEGEGRRVARAAGKAREGAGRPEGRIRRAAGAAGRPRKKPCSACAACASRSSRPRLEIEQAERAVRPEPRRRAEVRQAAPSSSASLQAETEARRTGSQVAADQGRGRRGGHRRGRQPLDRRPGLQAARRRDAEAAAPRRRAAPARHRPGRGGHGRRRGGDPRALGLEGSRTVRSAASSSWARPASARPSWRARWRSSCSTTNTP